MAHRVVAFVTDLFFTTQLESTAAQLNLSLKTVSSAKALQQEIERHIPTQVVVDLNSDPKGTVEAIHLIKSHSPSRSIRVLAFLSHVQTELADAAKHAGADAVVPRSYFSKHLREILLGNF